MSPLRAPLLRPAGAGTKTPARALLATAVSTLATAVSTLATAVSTLATAALALALGCGPVPGGKLSGVVTPAPASWADALGGDRALCEIESRPSRPHSIQLECFLHDGALFVQSHRWALASWWPARSWAAIWLDEPDVRVRIGEQLFELRAVRVTDAAVREPMLRERGYDPVPDGIVLFRLEPRS